MTTASAELLRQFAERLRTLAFRMPAPNEWTPQFVQLAGEVDAALTRAVQPAVDGGAVELAADLNINPLQALLKLTVDAREVYDRKDTFEAYNVFKDYYDRLHAALAAHPAPAADAEVDAVAKDLDILADEPTWPPRNIVGTLRKAAGLLRRLAAERGELKRICVEAVNATDGGATMEVSTEFLAHLPDEIAAIKKQRNEARATHPVAAAVAAEREADPDAELKSAANVCRVQSYRGEGIDTVLLNAAIGLDNIIVERVRARSAAPREPAAPQPKEG